jgi:hypothetical protein
MNGSALVAETPAFARSVTAIITGDVSALRRELEADPALVSARSASAHRATLLHYVAANGIEPELQRRVPNADEVARVLLAAGADVDAPCEAYGDRWRTTLDLAVSSDHPCEAGVTRKLVTVLCASGAAVEGPANDGSPLATALCFGILDGVQALLACGASADNPIFAAAAGDGAWMQAWRDGQTPQRRQAPGFLPLSGNRATVAEQALVFASMCGQVEVIRLLAEQAVNVNACPPGSHWTATPLHTAAIQGHCDAVRALLQLGADVGIKDPRHHGTALDWTRHARGPRRAAAEDVARMLIRAGAGTTGP